MNRVSRAGMASIGGGLVLAASLVAASLIHQATPDGQTQVGPVVVSASYGEWATGRTFEARAGEARFADSLASASTALPLATTGRWLVVDLDASCVIETCMVQNITLQVGDDEFSATERLDLEALNSNSLAAHIVSAGRVAFELPRDITERPGAATAELRLARTIDIRLDSQLRFTLNLTELPVADEVIVSRATQQGAR